MADLYIPNFSRLLFVLAVAGMLVRVNGIPLSIIASVIYFFFDVCRRLDMLRGSTVRFYLNLWFG